MGRLNKKLTLKSKKAEKDAKAKSKLESDEGNVDCGDKVLLMNRPSKKFGVKKSSSSVPKNLSKITKKEKMKMKSAALCKKLQFAADEKCKEKAQNKKLTKVDLKPMADTLDELLKEIAKPSASKTPKNQSNQKRKPTLKNQKKMMMENLSIFKQVLKHPEYVKNPFQTITTHIENKVLLESIEMDD